MSTIKIKSEHKETQGDFIIIDSENFVEGVHELFVENAEVVEVKKGKK